ncbi:MAG: lipopolysaccharide transport periplasmic protein LptA [Confluentimicrobium sp.]|uniref:LptA/OstA family protein n=1 Tax=Actibacterium sp. TaxID=1872125 RepID=UPI000C4035A6|nr:LptA/OstA family protein [Actibacterium sp.]MBC57012.1 lipopolysaccharide transport periplasmic protein LptA [Actibacterium sp.]
MNLRAGLAVLFLAALPAMALAQGAQVAFGGLRQDSSLPVEITADELRVDQAAGTAVFTGKVIIGQGEMRLTARKVVVEYATQNGTTPGRIARLHASGDVVLVNGAEAAEGREAVYSIDESSIVMTGDVILTQGQNALSGERLVVDLNSGTGVMEGRVKSIFQPGAEQ